MECIANSRLKFTFNSKVIGIDMYTENNQLDLI